MTREMRRNVRSRLAEAFLALPRFLLREQTSRGGTGAFLALAAALLAGGIQPVRAAPAEAQETREPEGAARGRVERGRERMRAGRPEEAEKEFLEATRLAPRDAAAWNGLGQARYAAKKWPSSLEAFEKARDLLPDEAKIHANVGICRFEMQQYEPAEAALREAVRLDPSYGKPRIFLGRIADDRGSPEEAERELRAAVEASPEEPLAPYYLGLLLFKNRRYAESAAAFQACLAVSPDLPSAHLNLGYSLVRLGERGRGEAHLETFRRLTGVFLADQERRLKVATRLTAAREDLEAGRVDGALRWALEARDLAPEVPAVHALLAEVYARQGRKEESERERREFLRGEAESRPR